MMRPIKFILNNEEVEITEHPARALLDVIREKFSLTGTKEGCREGDCGACTVLVGALHEGRVNYKSVNSCLMPAASVQNKHVVTVEGLNLENELTLVQNEFLDKGASQCGFCTPGFIVSLTGYFLQNEKVNLTGALTAIDGNICRCTGFASIIRAVEAVVNALQYDITIENKLKRLINKGLVPEYFSEIPSRLISFEKSDEEIRHGTFISGGTDLMVQRWDSLLDEDVSILNQNGSDRIRSEDGKIIIPGNTTISEMMESEIIKSAVPQFSKWFLLFGSEPIRNNATVAGNIVNASPIADSVNLLLVLNTKLKLVTETNKREVKLEEFYLSYKNVDLKSSELIESISFEIPASNSYIGWEKISKRRYLDIASVNSSIYLQAENNLIEEIRISAGGVAPIPILLKKTSEFFRGKLLEPSVIERSFAILESEISPISDARGSSYYKSLLLKRLIVAHFKEFSPNFAAEELL